MQAIIDITSKNQMVPSGKDDAKRCVDVLLNYWDKTYFQSLSKITNKPATPSTNWSDDKQPISAVRPTTSGSSTTPEQNTNPGPTANSADLIKTAELSGDAIWKFHTQRLSPTKFLATWSEPSKLEPIPRAIGGAYLNYTGKDTVQYQFQHHRLTHTVKLPPLDADMSTARFESEMDKLLPPPPTMAKRLPLGGPNEDNIKGAVGQDEQVLDKIALSKLKNEYIQFSTLGVPTKRLPEIIQCKVKVSDAINDGILLNGVSHDKPPEKKFEKDDDRNANTLDFNNEEPQKVLSSSKNENGFTVGGTVDLSDLDDILPNVTYTSDELMRRDHLVEHFMTESHNKYKLAFMNARDKLADLLEENGIDSLPSEKTGDEVAEEFNNIVVPETLQETKVSEDMIQEEEENIGKGSGKLARLLTGSGFKRNSLMPDDANSAAAANWATDGSGGIKSAGVTSAGGFNRNSRRSRRESATSQMISSAKIESRRQTARGSKKILTTQEYCATIVDNILNSVYEKVFVRDSSLLATISRKASNVLATSSSYSQLLPLAGPGLGSRQGSSIALSVGNSMTSMNDLVAKPMKSSLKSAQSRPGSGSVKSISFAEETKPSNIAKSSDNLINNQSEQNKQSRPPSKPTQLSRSQSFNNDKDGPGKQGLGRHSRPPSVGEIGKPPSFGTHSRSFTPAVPQKQQQSAKKKPQSEAFEDTPHMIEGTNYATARNTDAEIEDEDSGARIQQENYDNSHSGVLNPPSQEEDSPNNESQAADTHKEVDVQEISSSEATSGVTTTEGGAALQESKDQVEEETAQAQPTDVGDDQIQEDPARASRPTSGRPRSSRPKSAGPPSDSRRGSGKKDPVDAPIDTGDESEAI